MGINQGSIGFDVRLHRWGGARVRRPITDTQRRLGLRIFFPASDECPHLTDDLFPVAPLSVRLLRLEPRNRQVVWWVCRVRRHSEMPHRPTEPKQPRRTEVRPLAKHTPPTQAGTATPR